MSLPVAAALPITFILLLIKVWWDRHWRLRNLPTPVGFVVHLAHPTLTRSSLPDWCLSRLGP
jgi:hypothetical protein